MEQRFRFWVLLVLTCVLVACTPSRGGGGRDDDDDDDDGGDGLEETVPCEEGYYDAWSFDVANEGDLIRVRVDTVSAADTFDPALAVMYNWDQWEGGNFLGGGDDEFECSYPPPEYSCPEWEGEASVSGLHVIAVRCETGDDEGRYQLELWINGSTVTPDLDYDDNLDQESLQ